MKMIEIPDELFRRAKAIAALRGESVQDFITGVLRDRLDLRGNRAAELPGWRSVFGSARREEVEAVDAVIAEELERVDPREWRDR